jgi:imidazolonepropionase-like amidohydrolase
MRKFRLVVTLLLLSVIIRAQETFPVNGVADKRNNCYAFINGTIVKDAQTTIQEGSLIIREGKIENIGKGIEIPKDAIIINCKGKYIYPSFIDIYTDYGMPQRQAGIGGLDFFRSSQLTNNQKGAFGWNQAIHAEIDAVSIFSVDENKAKQLRDIGFGTVVTHQKDGIIRGTGTVVTLNNKKENLVILKERATSNLSFSKGTSTQSYPSSLMGTIALLRQYYNDAIWYKENKSSEKEGVNISLKKINENWTLPQIMDPTDRGIDLWNIMRADRIGDEFNVQYIIKSTGKEYQRINEVANTKAPLIVTVNFPQTQDLEDVNDARLVSLADLKNWELAPTNPGVIEKAGIPFCLSTADLKDNKSFLTNIKKAMEFGLTEKAALDALTKTPAQLMGIYEKVGSLENGKMANFLITSGSIFADKTNILQNWIQGERNNIKDELWKNINGDYQLTINKENYILNIKNNTTAYLINKDTFNTKFSFDGKYVKIISNNSIKKGDNKTKQIVSNTFNLSGYLNENGFSGNGKDSLGNLIVWSATLQKEIDKEIENEKTKNVGSIGKTIYPFTSFGVTENQIPKQENILFKNATIWTSEKEGVLNETDLLVKNGKIVKIGKNINEPLAKIIDASGKHLTAGIIDEHSHIACSSINEGGQSVTSEVRIQDNLNPDDVNIYRQLSGGVTTSHILHGSANTIGGQTQLIKLRWGVNDEQLKFKGADPFIKFALGENVKRTTMASGNNRFPDTRMGVEQVLTDAFTRAKEYEANLKGVEIKDKTVSKSVIRKDLELDALVEIMNKKRFITCHSYVASEILSTMQVAEKFGFKVNTFTHILEGYKVADKMKEHGASASTFSDWWAYKNEVQDAIPYNAAIMHKVGLNVAINSDDAEMARRLNQEAAKAIKYGGLTETEALNLVTINPAKMLHVDDKVGSIKEGKDADVVLWNDNPLSIYAKALYTVVDGTIYFDRNKDEELRKEVKKERNRLINKMVGEKKTGGITIPVSPSFRYMHNCSDHEEKLRMLDVDIEDIN